MCTPTAGIKGASRRFATGLRPGLNTSFYFGLLARPMPAAAFAAVTAYSGADMSDELAQDVMAVD